MSTPKHINIPADLQPTSKTSSHVDSLPMLDRQDLDRLFASQYVQAGTFGAEAQGIENSVKGVGWVSDKISATY